MRYHFASVTLVLIVLTGVACSAKPEFQGTLLDGQPAAGFQLTDQHSDTLALDAMRGKVVVLTFLYTNCPDICPIIAQKLRTAQEELGSAAEEVAFVAITVDPETDTVQRLQQYTTAMGMQGHWYFLTGTREQLRPIWEAYYVSPLPENLVEGLDASHGSAHDDLRLSGAHTAPVYLIDRQNRRRLLHSGGDLSVQDLLHDVRLLLQNS